MAFDQRDFIPRFASSVRLSREAVLSDDDGDDDNVQSERSGSVESPACCRGRGGLFRRHRGVKSGTEKRLGRGVGGVGGEGVVEIIVEAVRQIPYPCGYLPLSV